MTKSRMTSFLGDGLLRLAYRCRPVGRRKLGGREPYYVNAEVTQVVECGQDAGDVP
jgi:hypothetical protein